MKRSLRKPTALLAIAALVWCAGPGPALAAGRAVSVPNALSSPALGAAPLPGAPAAAIGSPGASLAAPALAGSNLFTLSPLPAFTPAAAPAAKAALAAEDAPPARIQISPAAPSRTAVAVPQASRRVPQAKAVAEKVRPGTARAALSELGKRISSGERASNAADAKVELDAAFSGVARPAEADPVPAAGAALGTLRPGGLTRPSPEAVNHAQSPLAVEPAVAAVVSQGREKKRANDKEEKLPRSFYLYLTGQLLYGIGQESAALIAPLYAYFASGLEFAVLSGAVSLIAVIPGSIIGSRLIRKFDSKKVYLVGNLLHAAFFLSVPLLHFLTGTFSPIHFLVFKAVGGLIYGSLRGVAEKEIAPRIIGQDNQGQLKKAGSMFYTAFESAEFISAISIGFMIAAFGLNWASALMAGVMLTSVIPLWFMRFKQKGPVADTGETGGTETSLPWKLYLPFVFAIFVHMSLYDFITPFMALEVFHMETLASRFIAAYTFGSLAVALFTSYRPKIASKLSERGWTALGIASTIAFLWGGLLLKMPWVSMGLAGILGVALTGMMIQWRAVYQQRLKLSVQPKVFERLMIASVLMTLIPFAVMQGGLLLAGSSAMVTLLTIVSAGITAGALGYPLIGSLLRRLRKPKR